MIPYWRYVRYTDDGCAIFQCLNCKNEWEARTAPGWFDSYETFDHPVEGASKYLSTIDGVQTPHWSRKREKPIYKPVFRFCPFCGINWEGPIRCNDDNENMYGPKRLARENKIRERESALRYDDEYYKRHEPSWWWVLERREIWPDREEPEPWKAEAKYNPNRASAIYVYRELLDEREKCLEDDRRSAELFAVKHEARIVKRAVDEHYQHTLRHVYERYVRTPIKPISIVTLVGE